MSDSQKSITRRILRYHCSLYSLWADSIYNRRKIKTQNKKVPRCPLKMPETLMQVSAFPALILILNKGFIFRLCRRTPRTGIWAEQILTWKTWQTTLFCWNVQLECAKTERSLDSRFLFLYDEQREEKDKPLITSFGRSNVCIFRF